MFYKEDWEQCKARFDAYWEGELVDRCCIAVTAPRSKPIDSKTELRAARDLVEQWTSSEYQMHQLVHHLSTTYFGGEAFPRKWVNMGPGIMSAFVGSPYVFAPTTVWFDSDPIIRDWTHKPVLQLDEDRDIWKTVWKLTEFFARESKGSYMTGITDLGGNLDIAASLRGTETLLFDLIEHPEEVKALVEEIDRIWFQCYEKLQTLINRHAEGTAAWMGLWCRQRWYPLQCDFSAMISPAMFEEFVKPALTREAAFLDKSIYHCDGPGQLPHVDHLLDIDRITGIQWQPGAGNPDMGSEKWYPLYRRIQAKGKNLVIDWVPPEKIEKLLENISPKGVIIGTRCQTEEEAKELIKKVEKWSI